MLPKMEIPEVHSYEAVFERAIAGAKGKKPAAALVVPSNVDTLRAFIRAAGDGLLEPIAIGDEALLQRTAQDQAVDISRFRVLDINQPDMAVRTAGKMADAGEVDLLVQGRVPIGDLLSLLFEKEQGFLTKGRLVSHVAVMDLEKYPKLLMLTDSAVMPEPDLKAKLGLIDNLVHVAGRIGITCPRIAVVAAVEMVYPQMPVTMEAAVLSKMAERGQIKGALVDGPLSFDVAVDMFAAHAKGVKTSEVAGQADAILSSSIEVANGVYNAMSLYGNCRIGGVVVGGRVPVAVNSPADSEAACYNSIVLSTLLS